MEIKVVRPFHDKFNLTREFKPGEVVDFEPKRAEIIVERGLGEYVRAAVEAEHVAEAESVVSETAAVTEHENVVSEAAVEEAPKKNRKPRQKKED